MHQSLSTRGHLINFTRALLVCTSLTVIGMSGTPAVAAPGGGPAAAFLKKYNACDARILATYWGISFGEAKVTGGQKILVGNNSTLREVLGTARSQSQCYWADTGFNYDDATLLATYWGRTIDDAKSKVVVMFSQGQSGDARRALKQARRG